MLSTTLTKNIHYGIDHLLQIKTNNVNIQTQIFKNYSKEVTDPLINTVLTLIKKKNGR